MSKFARSSKNCEKLEKSQFWLKLVLSVGTGAQYTSSRSKKITSVSMHNLLKLFPNGGITEIVSKGN